MEGDLSSKGEREKERIPRGTEVCTLQRKTLNEQVVESMHNKPV
jgi:hypothetical protein